MKKHSSKGFLSRLNKGSLRHKIPIIIIVILYVGIFFTSLAYTTIDKNNYIDGGWKYGLSSFRHHHTQSFGNNVFFTYGPLSTRIVTTVNNQDTIKDFIVGLIIITGLLGLCLYSLVSALRSYDYRDKLLEGGTIAIGSICMLSIVGVDILFFITLLAVYKHVMTEERLSRKLLLLAGPALLATYKNSFLITIILVLLLAGLSLRYPFKKKILSVVSLLLLPLVFLVFEGVSVLNLPTYLIYTLKNGLAYGDFMNLTDHPGICTTFFWIFIAYACLCSATALFETRLKPRKLVAIGLPLIGEFWIIFIALKEAITRSDAHLLVFLPFIFYMLMRILMVLNKFLRLSFMQYTLVSLAIFLICVRIFAPMNKRLILNFTRQQYFTNVINQISLREVVKHYDYAYFAKERKISQQSFSNLTSQTSLIRQSLNEYLDKNHLHNVKIAGYGNSLFFLPATAPANYVYSPFMQNYPAQPPQLFDKLYKDFLVQHPDYLVFWDKIAPNIDSKLPSQDLPQTDRYLQTEYTVAASDKDHGMFILAKKNVAPSNNEKCSAKTFKTHLGNSIEIGNDARSIRIIMDQSLRNKLKDTIYKKPIYEIYLYDKSGNQRQFRIVPATLEDNFYVNPWLPFIADNRAEDSFQVSKINLASSDQRTPPMEVSITSCSD